MTKSIDYFMSKIPLEMGREIFSFLIPGKNTITFRNITQPVRSSYSEKYERAFIGDKIVKNEKGEYLCRISKKNGKHRYYITEDLVDVIHVEHHDSIRPIYYYDYYSIYVGKDIDSALIKLLY
jgi:hypothetical protein